MNIDWNKHPEATHFDPVDQNFLRELDHALLLFNINKGWMVPLYTQYGVTIEDCNRPLIKRPEWDGEGLPSVGAICEIRSHKLNDFSPATIKFASHNVIVWDWVDEPVLNGLCTAYVHAIEIRPLRTAEQIAADERAEAIKAMIEDSQPDYSAGELLNSSEYVECAISALYDAGYRKQVAP